MRCRRARRMLPLLVGGEIRGRRAEILDFHVRRCVRCREKLASYESARQSLFRLKGARTGPGPDLWPEIRQRLGGPPVAARRRVRPVAVWAAAVAATLLIALGIGRLDRPSGSASTVVEEGVALAPDLPEPASEPVSPGDGEYPLQQVGLVTDADAESFDAFPSVHSAAPDRVSWDEF